jgi:hypothetical protein
VGPPGEESRAKRDNIEPRNSLLCNDLRQLFVPLTAMAYRLNHPSRRIRAMSVLVKSRQNPPIYWALYAFQQSDIMELIRHRRRNSLHCRYLEIGLKLNTVFFGVFEQKYWGFAEDRRCIRSKKS